MRPPVAPMTGSKPSSAFAFAYAILILLFVALNTGLVLYGYKYALKDDLRLTATQLSYSNLAVSIPLFLSFSFGLLRDRWRPFSLVDRPYLLTGPIVVCISCLVLSAVHRSLYVVVGLIMLINAGAMLSGAATSAMLALLSKHFGVSGRIAVGGMIVPNLIGMGLMPLTGHLVQSGGFTAVCRVSAWLAVPGVLLAFFRPARLFPTESEAPDRPTLTGSREPFWPAVRRLVRSRSALLAALICFLWDFTPGWGTPLFYQYTNVLHFAPQQVEFTYSVGTIGTTLSALLYGVTCFRFPTRRLLIIGIVVA